MLKSTISAMVPSAHKQVDCIVTTYQTRKILDDERITDWELTSDGCDLRC